MTYPINISSSREGHGDINQILDHLLILTSAQQHEERLR